MKETMADRIKRLRIEAGMTQEELAEHLGTQKAIISKYESGRVSNLKRETIKKMADIFNVTPSYLMCFEDELPAKNIGNVSYPAAHAIPILGTICAGDGVYADQNFDGFFFVDNSIRADCCLHVHGDSMVDAGIHDGDIAFLKQDVVIEDGDICGVVLKNTNEAVLKKLYRADGGLILQPCNAEYKPIIADPNDVQIVGEMVGVYRKVK